jgi:DNA polymerase I-like protein with 3'-5' exonuclease and polymerase domains
MLRHVPLGPTLVEGLDRVIPLQARPELDCHMLLTVHDELVFEVAAAHVQAAAALVKERMESAVELDVPLRADIGWGANWAEAAPEGH